MYSMGRSPQELPYNKKICIFARDRYFALIGVKICTMVELCPMRGFLHLWWQMGGGAQNVYGQFVFDVASVTNVIYNSPIMRGRAIHHHHRHHRRL